MTVTGRVALFPLATTITPAASTYSLATLTSSDAESGFYRFRHTTAQTSGTITFAYSPGIDVSNSVILAFSTGGTRLHTIDIRFQDSLGNYSDYRFLESASFNDLVKIFDLDKTPIATSGVLDRSNVTTIIVTTQQTQVATLATVDFGLVQIDALSLANTTNASFTEFVTHVFSGSVITVTPGLADNIKAIIAIATPLDIVASTNYDGSGFSGIAFLANFNTSTFASSAPALDIANNKRKVTFSQSSALEMRGRYFDLCSIVDNTTAQVDLISCPFVNLFASDLGSLRFFSSSFLNCETITGGSQYQGTEFFDTLHDYNGASTFDDVVFSGTQDYYIRIGSDNVSNNATIDVSRITFGTPGITHFLIDGVTGIEIATAAGASLTKTEINSGSATFVTPTIAVTITGLVATSRVKIYDTGTTNLVDGINSSGTSFVWETGVATQGYDIYVVLPGRESQFIEDYIYPDGSASLPVSQPVDLNYAATSSLVATFTDTDLSTTADIYYDVPNKLVYLDTGVNLLATTGISGQDLYSKTIETRYANDTLMPYHRMVFAVDIDSGKLELNGWALGNATSRNLLRNVGLAQYDAVGGTLQASWMGVLGLGNIDATEVPYYVQTVATDADPTNAINPGLPNQIVPIYGDAGHGNFDLTDDPFVIFVRTFGRNVARYDLKAEQNITTLAPLRYSIPLLTSTNPNLVTDDTSIDANSDGTADVVPYSGMSLTWLTSAAVTDWANATAYDPFDYVESGGSFWITVEGGTSSGTGVADDVGVVWYEIDSIYQANGGTTPQMINYLFWAQRQAGDIDAGTGDRTGKIVPALATTEGSNMVLRPGLWAIGFDVSATLTHFPTEVDGTRYSYPAPPNQIIVSGIPEVENAILAIQNLTTDAITYPTLSGGGATVELEIGTNYKLMADAPGYLRQEVTVPGNTPTFTFSMQDFRALYESGASLAAYISFNFSTYVVEVTYNSGVTYSFANVFRTLEDYLSTENGVLFPYPPFPVIVDVGGGNGRNYLFFPYDTNLNQVNPVTIRPNDSNTADPTLTDFVIVLEDATAPLFDIFDFSSGGGKTIRFQTEAVAASVVVSGSGALTTDQANQLTAIATRTARVDGLIEDSTGDRFTAKALETAGGGGATINAQDVADALKLAPTAGTPAAGSVYAELDSLLAGTGGTLSYDLPQFIALMRADAAFKRALSEGALIAGLGDELALIKTQVWTRSDVRTAWNTLIVNAGVTAPSVGEVTAWNSYVALLPGLIFASNGEVSYAG